MKPTDATARHDDAVEQASAWCLRLADGSLTIHDQVQLEAWLEADEANRIAFDDAVRTWQAVELTAVTPELIDMRTAALDSFRRANRARWAPRLLSPTLRVATAAAAIVVLVVGLGAWIRYTPHAYRTGVGERQVVVLSDGSKLSLDAATRVDVLYLGSRRELHLDYGRAKFTVAKNLKRPFTVAAGDKVVLATGTEFSVEMLRNQVRVILYQGHVAVFDNAAQGKPARHLTLAGGAAPADRVLVPGRELVAIASAPVAEVIKTDPIRSLSWEGGQLVFVDEPLISAVEQVNRYSDDKLVVGDAATGRIAISGVFTAGDTAAFVEGVTGVFPVRAQEVDGRLVLLNKGG